MDIEVFVLCDAATEAQGKLNVLGAFDHIWARQAPAVHPQCTVALRLRYKRIESGAHRIRLNFVDADGRSILPPLDANTQVQIRDPDDSSVAHLILNMQQLKFEKFGRFSIDLAIDGKHEASLPLYVSSMPPQAGSSPAGPAQQH